jgi:hypothetical protein
MYGWSGKDTDSILAAVGQLFRAIHKPHHSRGLIGKHAGVSGIQRVTRHPAAEVIPIKKDLHQPRRQSPSIKNGAASMKMPRKMVLKMES